MENQTFWKSRRPNLFVAFLVSLCASIIFKFFCLPVVCIAELEFNKSRKGAVIPYLNFEFLISLAF